MTGSTFIKGKDSSETIQNNLEGTDKEITWCLRGHNVSRCVFQLEVGPWLGLNVSFDSCFFTLLSSTVHHHWNFGGIQYRTVPAYFHPWVKVKELLYVNNRVAPEGILYVFECVLLKEKVLESLWGVSQVTWLSQLKGSVRTGPSVCHIWRLCRQSSVSGPCQLGSHQKVRMLHHWPCQLGLWASPTVNSWHSQPRRPLDRHALASDSSEMCEGAWRHRSKARHS